MNKLTIKTPIIESVITCGEGAVADFAYRFAHSPVFGGIMEQKNFAVITDDNVYWTYKPLIEQTFDKKAHVFVLPAGEETKNYENLIKIIEFFIKSGLKRNGVVIALGGGVIGDITGLAASIYMRGTRLVQIPTTLLAQVDSSVGGKTAIDYGHIKNVIGSFYQPEEVIVDPQFLSTLPEREIRCGMGEIIKYGALDAEILAMLEAHTADIRNRIVADGLVFKCISHKAKVVSEDERDLNGTRKSLNLGHTTGHAFELYYGKKSHGEFVLTGMYYELYIAVKQGICVGQYADRLKKLIKLVIGKPPKYDDVANAAKFAAYDKKNTGSQISLIVPADEGKFAELQLDPRQYTALLCEYAESLK